MEIYNKNILITGGASDENIDLATSLMKNNKVILSGSNSTELLLAHDKYHWLDIFPYDRSDKISINALIAYCKEVYGGIDLLFNNESTPSFNELVNQLINE